MAKSKVAEDNTLSKEEEITGKTGFRRTGSPNQKSTRRRKNAKFGKHSSSNKSGYHGSNDISWYTLTSELLDSTTKLNFNIPTGSLKAKLYSRNEAGDIGFGESGSATLTLGPNNDETERGVMSISLIPTYGIANTNTDAINKAAMVLYNTERAANASVSSFDATDNMKVVLAYDSGLAWLAFLKRLYGVITNYAYINKFTPQTLVRAMGCDYDDIVFNRLNLFNHINMLVSRMKSFVMPNGMALMDRHEYLFEHIFMDVADPKGYFMLYNPKFLYRYKAVQNTNDPCLEPVYIGPIINQELQDPEYMKYSDIVQISEFLIGSWNDQDFVTIGAEMLKAFEKIGGNARREIASMPADYAVQYEYDLNWLSQVQNMDWIVLDDPYYRGGSRPTTADWRKGDSIVANVVKPTAPYSVTEVIPSNPNISPYLRTHASYTAKLPSTYGNHLLLSRLKDPQPSDIMYSTRLMFNDEIDFQNSELTEPVSDAYQLSLDFNITSCGSEIAVGVEMFGITGDDVYNPDMKLPPHVAIYLADGIEMVDGNIWEANDRIEGLVFADRYNFHPQIKMFQLSANTTGDDTYVSVTSKLPSADLDNFAVMSQEQLKWMHDTAMQALCMVRLAGIEDQFK